MILRNLTRFSTLRSNNLLSPLRVLSLTDPLGNRRSITSEEPATSSGGEYSVKSNLGRHGSNVKSEDSGSSQTSGRKRMRAWEIHNYGGCQELQLNEDTRVPLILDPNEVLVKVEAASVNPIDIAMTKGYGSETISLLRKLEKGKFPLPGRANRSTVDFPITLGRDLAGVIVEKGCGVRDLKVGDEVFGVLGFTEHGSHAEFTVCKDSLLRKKPSYLSFTEAASFPYVGLTCWSAIKVTGNLFDLRRKRVLVLGGSGGVGSFAVQYLVALGAQVVATCSSDATELVESFLIGQGSVVDYTQPDHMSNLKSLGPYDCVLNVSGPGSDRSKVIDLLNPFGQYITLSPPLLSNFDKYGIVRGGLVNAFEVAFSNVNSFTSHQALTKWAFFTPSSTGLTEITQLIEKGQILPVIDQVFKFEELPLAYDRVEGGHLRGKILIEF